MASTHTPLCTVKGCPEPKNPDFHVPICGHGLEGQHHHVVKRSQGGKGGPQVFICPDCHNEIDNGEWGNAVSKLADGDLLYHVWDIRGKELFSRIISADGAAAGEQQNTGMVGDGQASAAALTEGEDNGLVKGDTSSGAVDDVGTSRTDRRADNQSLPVEAGSAAGDSAGGYVLAAQAQGNAPGEKRQRDKDEPPSSAAPSASTEEAAGGQRGMTTPAAEGAVAEAHTRSQVISPSTAAAPSFDEWDKGIRSIAFAGRTWRWEFGDQANRGELFFSERSWNTLSEVKLSYGTIRNMMRICSKVPEPLRSGKLDWTLWQILYSLPNLEDMEEWIEWAIENEATTNQLTDKLREVGLKPPKEPKMGQCPECQHKAELSEFKKGVTHETRND